MRFTELVLQNVDSFSSRPNSELEADLIYVREKVTALVEYVNNHGGWTVVGWHRQGILLKDNENDFQVNTATAGHLVLLKPSWQSLAESHYFHDNLRVATRT
jgi:hypothetical protein